LQVLQQHQQQQPNWSASNELHSCGWSPLSSVHVQAAIFGMSLPECPLQYCCPAPLTLRNASGQLLLFTSPNALRSATG
jgi:hypothetical protein